MIEKYENKRLQLNTNLRGQVKGTVVKIKVDKAGTPVERYWRDRVRDSKIDSCVEFVGAAKSVEPVEQAADKKAKTAKRTAAKPKSAE